MKQLTLPSKKKPKKPQNPNLRILNTFHPAVLPLPGTSCTDSLSRASRGRQITAIPGRILPFAQTRRAPSPGPGLPATADAPGSHPHRAHAGRCSPLHTHTPAPAAIRDATHLACPRCARSYTVGPQLYLRRGEANRTRQPRPARRARSPPCRPPVPKPPPLPGRHSSRGQYERLLAPAPAVVSHDPAVPPRRRHPLPPPGAATPPGRRLPGAGAGAAAPGRCRRSTKHGHGHGGRGTGGSTSTAGRAEGSGDNPPRHPRRLYRETAGQRGELQPERQEEAEPPGPGPPAGTGTGTAGPARALGGAAPR